MESLIYIFFYLISVYFAFRVGWKAREVHAMRLVGELTQAVEQEEETETPIRVVIEKHSDGFFVYNMEDHSFMAQGSDRNELEKNLISRYPGKNFAANHDNLIEVGFARNESI